jgi:hypothetical protein
VLVEITPLKTDRVGGAPLRANGIGRYLARVAFGAAGGATTKQLGYKIGVATKSGQIVTIVYDEPHSLEDAEQQIEDMELTILGVGFEK